MTRILTIIAFLFATPAWAVTPEECSEKGLFFDIEIKKVMRGSLGTKKVERPFCSTEKPKESESLNRYLGSLKVGEKKAEKLKKQEEKCRAKGKSYVQARPSNAGTTGGRGKKREYACIEDRSAFVRNLCLNHFEYDSPNFLKCVSLLEKNGNVSQSYSYHTAGPDYAVHTGHLALSALATVALNSRKKPCDVREKGNSVITLDEPLGKFTHVCEVDGKLYEIKYGLSSPFVLYLP